jgi:hypothetical protein
MPKELDDVRWIVNIPEFHDSQRLRDRLRYVGPYVRSFALPGIDKLTLPAFNNWVLVGLVMVDTWTDPITRDYSVGGATVLAGPVNARRVPSWSHFSNLGLANIWNCVFLQHRAGAPETTGWSAIIGEAKFDSKGREKRCIPADGRPLGVSLAVVAEAPARRDWEVPGVARVLQFGDSAYGIGIRCAAVWCNVMPKGTSVPNPPPHASVASLMGTPQGSIRGWYDDQQLVSPIDDRVGRSSALGPEPRASIIPEASLMMKTLTDFRTGFVKVATIYIPPGPSNPIPKHYAKWGFKPGKNEIFMHMMDAVFGVGYLKAGTDSIPLRVHRHSHKEDVPPGFKMWETARWAYIDDDDAVWVGCDVGCCFIDVDTRM